MTKRLRDFLVVAAVALSAWELLVRATGVPPYILPGPLRVASAAVEYAELIGEHTLVTLAEVLVGRRDDDLVDEGQRDVRIQIGDEDRSGRLIEGRSIHVDG